MINLLLIYRQDALSAHARISSNPGGGRFWGFRHAEATHLHRWSEIDSPATNFTPTRIYDAHISTLVTTCLRAKERS